MADVPPPAIARRHDPDTVVGVVVAVASPQDAGKIDWTRSDHTEPVMLEPGRMLLIDFGAEINGRLHLEAEPSAVVGIGYSETSAYARPEGDMACSALRIGGNPRRSDRAVLRGGSWSARWLQGGFRYAVLRLEGSEAVRITRVSVERGPRLGTTRDYDGRFRSSDPLLDDLWAAGANTVFLNALPKGTDFGNWHVEDAGVNVSTGWFSPNSNPVGLLRTGHDWRDVDIDIDVDVVRGHPAIAVRAADRGNLVLIGVGTDELLVSLRTHSDEDAVTTLSRHPLPSGPRRRKLHIRLRADSLSIRSAEEIARVDLPSGFERGTVGLCAGPDDEGIFSDLTIRTASGEPLLVAPLKGCDQLALFDRPDVTTADVLLDGVKRDRMVWQGDNVVTAPALFVISRRTEFARDSLRQLAAHQLPSGYIPAVSHPAASLHVAPSRRPGLTLSYPSLSYSLYSIDNLFDYWWQTGDIATVGDLWPSVVRVLEDAHRDTDPDGLVRVGAHNGMGWRYAAVEGTPSYENVLLSTALFHASLLAAALGDESETSRLAAAARQHLDRTIASFWDDDLGCLVQSIEAPDVVALDSNIAALRSGRVPQELSERMLDAIANLHEGPHGVRALAGRLPADAHQIVGPFMVGQYLWCLADNGRLNHALRLAREGWTDMAHGDPGMTTWEVRAPDGTVATPGLNLDGGGHTSMAHPWGAGPTVLLSRAVLGVRATSAGFGTWVLQPGVGDLRWAEGSVPTPHGAVGVRWCVEGNELAVTAWVPAGTRGSLLAPRGWEPVENVMADSRKLQGRFRKSRGPTRSMN